MRESLRFLLARAAKWAAVASLVLILAVVAAHFALRRRAAVAPPAVPAAPPPAPGADVDRKEGIEHVIFKGDLGRVKVKADRFYVGEDKLNHLEGRVEVIDYGRTGGRALTVTADKVDYDDEMTFFRVSGGARVRDRDAVFSSEAFEYDKPKETVRTDRGVEFTSGRLDAKARGLVYKRRAETIELAGDVALALRPRLETSAPLNIAGQSFEYRRKATSGRVEGGVRMTHARSGASAERLLFLLGDDEQQVKALTLLGAAEAVFFREADGGKAVAQRIKADEIRMVSYPDTQALQRLKAKGGCVLEMELEPGANDVVRSDQVSLLFDRKGEMRDFWAVGSARLALGTGTAGERRVRGETVSFSKKGDVLRAEGAEGAPARIDSERTEVEAASVTVGTASGNMRASGGVKLVLKPVPDGGTVGFFAKDRPVLVTCGNLAYAGERKSFAFKDGVRIWQDKDVLAAEEFDVQEGDGAVSGRGGVKASLSHAPKDKPAEERLEIASDRMAFAPGPRTIAFEGACSLRTASLAMTAKSLDMALAKEGSGMESLRGKGKVVISREGQEGRGEEAFYDLGAETVVMTGRPVLVDREKGVTEGDKLTFHLGDGRITIENKERDRSATVIRS